MFDLKSTYPLAYPRSLRLSRVEEHFLRALLFTVVWVLVFKVLYFFEANVLLHHPRAARFVGEATDTATRYIGIPHIVIGFIFLITSRSAQTLRMRLAIFGLLTIGSVLCAAYGMAGGKSNKIAFALVYLYFLVHEMRDQAMFYTVFGDSPPIRDKPAFERIVRAAIAIAISGVILVVWASLGVFSPRYSLLDPTCSLPFRIVLSLASIAGWAVAACAILGNLAGNFAGVRALYREHKPFFHLIAGVVGVLGLSLLLTGRPYSLILFHVISWYLFTNYRLAKNPPITPPLTLWSRMRTSLRGFRQLHNGMVATLLVVGIVWVFGFGKPPALDWLLAEEAFPYWTILHVTVSFARR